MNKAVFYYAPSKLYERHLLALLEKIVKRGERAILRTPDDIRLHELDSLLWTIKQESFLPHGCGGEDDPKHCPIWLTDGTDNPNGSTILVLCDHANGETDEKFEQCLSLIRKDDDASLHKAQALWHKWQGAGLEVTAYHQEAAATNGQQEWKKCTQPLMATTDNR